MRDQLDLGPVPVNEPCEQLGPTYEPSKARAECAAYIKQLRAQFGPEPGSARFRITSNPHDFGTYYEVAVVFDDNDEKAIDYAFRCESEAWPEWRDATPLVPMDHVNGAA